MGISKYELFNDYYMDEFSEVLYEYNELHAYDRDEDVEEVSGQDFFGF